MIEAIENFFLNTVGRELCVLFCSVIPIIELRGGIPLGWSLGLPWWQSYIFAVIGNMLPVPMILLGVNWFIGVLARSRVGFLSKLAKWLQKKAEKNRPKIEKYGFWGVCFFVALPLPITGAWTGALVCATMGQKFWKSLLSCFLGVCIAGFIMTLVSYLVSTGVSWLSFLV